MFGFVCLFVCFGDLQSCSVCFRKKTPEWKQGLGTEKKKALGTPSINIVLWE